MPLLIGGHFPSFSPLPLSCVQIKGNTSKIPRPLQITACSCQYSATYLRRLGPGSQVFILFANQGGGDEDKCIALVGCMF